MNGLLKTAPLERMRTLYLIIMTFYLIIDFLSHDFLSPNYDYLIILTFYHNDLSQNIFFFCWRKWASNGFCLSDVHYK